MRAAFLVSTSVVVYYAVRGGSFDLVVRHEEAIAVWWILGLGFALGLLRAPRWSWELGIPLIAITVLALWTGISAFWAESTERTTAEVARILHYEGLILLVWSIVAPRTWRAVAGGVCAGAALVCALAVGSRLLPGLFPENTVAEVLRTTRLNYPFNYWNALGAWSAMSVAMLIAWSAHAARTHVRAGCLALVPFSALAAYLTYSRATALATVLAALLAIALSRNRLTAAAHTVAAALATAIPVIVVRGQEAVARGSGGAGAELVGLALLGGAAVAAGAVVLMRRNGTDRRRLRFGGARVAAGVLALVACLALIAPGGGVPAAWNDFRERTPPVARGDPAARLPSLNGERYYIWGSALDAFEERPLTGIGAGSFEFWWNDHGGVEFLRDAHSVYLEQLAELGLPGLALVLVALGGLALSTLKARGRARGADETAATIALAAATLVFLLQAGVDWLWESTAVSALALAGAALSGSLHRPRARPRPTGRAGLALAALLVCVFQLPALVSVSLTRDSQRAVRDGSLSTAAGRANEAVEAQPWAASPYLQRALVSEAADDLTAAGRDLRRAARRERSNWRAQLLLARVEAKRGRIGPALRAYRSARRLRPHSSFLPER